MSWAGRVSNTQYFSHDLKEKVRKMMITKEKKCEKYFNVLLIRVLMVIEAHSNASFKD